MSSYEERRLKNIEDNKKILAELGLLNPYLKLNVSRSSALKTIQHTVKKKSTKKRVAFEPASPVQPGKRRKSSRLRGIAAEDVDYLPSDDEESDNESCPPRPVYVHKENIYGQIVGTSVGDWWETRMECSRAGIHRPTVAGIHGDTTAGAYSVALSGGYEDNIDMGECFTYTGEGGRDLTGTKANPKNLRTAPQSKDQTLTRGNLALSKSVETGNPVRVIRGYKLPTVFAPETGYRYDGLYTVQKAWYTTGGSGFGVWKFAFKRCSDQPPLPFEITQESGSPEKSTKIVDVIKEQESQTDNKENLNVVEKKDEGEDNSGGETS